MLKAGGGAAYPTSQVPKGVIGAISILARNGRDGRTRTDDNGLIRVAL